MNIERLKILREEKGLSQQDIADLLKVKQQQYSKYEIGVNLIPVEKLSLLADFYGVSVDYLIGKTENPVPYPKSTKLEDKKSVSQI